MTADDLTRRAIIAAHDAGCGRQCGEDALTFRRLTSGERAIVALWREDRDDILKGAAATALTITARAEKAEAERDEHSEQFGGLAECGGEGVDCDIHPVTLVDHEGPVSCVWCSLSAARDRAEKAEAEVERLRTATGMADDLVRVETAEKYRERAATTEAAIERARNICAWVTYKVPSDPLDEEATG